MVSMGLESDGGEGVTAENKCWNSFQLSLILPLFEKKKVYN